MPFALDNLGVYSTGAEATDASQKLLLNWENLARQIHTGLVWAHLIPGVTGAGTTGSPYMPPAGQTWNQVLGYAAGACICFGPFIYGTNEQIGFHQDGLSRLQLIGFGATIKYTGSSNISTLAYFSGNEFLLGNEGVDIKGITFDGNGKVTGDMIFIQSLHTCSIDVSCVNGTNTATALKILGCSGPSITRFRCTRFDHAGNVNPFLHGLVVDEVGATSNDTTVASFRGLEISGTQGTGILVNNTLAAVFAGGVDAVVSGWGAEIGMTGPCESIMFENFDLELNGPIIVATGGHQGLRIGNVTNTVILNCENLDASLQIESTAGQVTAINTHFYGLVHNNTNPFVQIGCSGMDEAVSGQVTGSGYNRPTIGKTLSGLHYYNEGIFGRGTNGATLNYSNFGNGFSLYANGTPSPGSQFAMYQNLAGDVQLSGKTITINVPPTLPTYTVSTLPTGANGRIAYASNGRKSGEGAGVGTGSHVTYSNGQWRRQSDETTIAA